MATLAAHRDTDLRVCGATTVVIEQSSVYVNGKLWAVDGDPNSHGDGILLATLANEVYINNKKVCLDTELANADDLCNSNDHCDPFVTEGSSDVFTGI